MSQINKKTNIFSSGLFSLWMYYLCKKCSQAELIKKYFLASYDKIENAQFIFHHSSGLLTGSGLEVSALHTGSGDDSV